MRPQSIVLSRITYIVVGIITQQIAPRQLSAQAWNWGGRAGLFWLGCNLIAIVYCYFRLPESKGRTYGELDVLFVSIGQVVSPGEIVVETDAVGKQGFCAQVCVYPG